jgi:sortase A
VVENVRGARRTYVVRDARVLDRQDGWVAEQLGPTRLTLVTCYPFDTLRAGGAERYVVWAYAVENSGTAAASARFGLATSTRPDPRSFASAGAQAP